jgi:fatty-acyl-CoA synthase
VITHFSLLNNAMIDMREANETDYGKIICSPFLMYHIGSIMFSMCALITSNQVVFPSFKADLNDIRESIAQYKCNTFFCSPKLLHNILEAADTKDYDLSTLKYVSTGSQFVPKRLVDKLRKELNVNKILIKYGMTELNAISHSTHFDDIESDFVNLIGKPIPFIECKVVDHQTGHILPLNEEGELCVRGFSVIKKYYNNEQKTREAIDENGWYF